MTVSGRARVPQSFDAVLTQVDEWLVPGGVPGVGVAVWHRGAIVAERYAGQSTLGVSVGPDTIFPLASVTKPIAAATAMTLVEDGLIALDESVAPYVPELVDGSDAAEQDGSDGLRGSITLRHLLSHTSGLPEDVGPRDGRYTDAPSLETLTDALVRLPLQSSPGEVVRYSNAGYAVLARLVERLTGKEFWSLAEKRILRSRALAEIFARPDSALTPRIATLADSLHPGTSYESYNSPYWRDLAIPWGGLYGTPRSLVHFAAGFLPESSEEIGLASPTRLLMRTDQAGSVPGGVESGRVSWPIARWGLGWEVKGEKRNHWTGDLASPATFCHFGQAGTLLWGDSERDLAVAVFANRAVTRMWTFILARWIRLNNSIVAVADSLAV